MLTITDGASLSRALRTALDRRLKQLLTERVRQLDVDIKDNVRFIIVQPGDTLHALEAELGFPIGDYSDDRFGCEWIEDHGGIAELVWILTDDGFAHVVLIDLSADLDPAILSLCTAQT